MNDRTAPTDRDDAITLRLVRALDALPLPAGPGHLRARSTRPRARTLLVVAAALFILIAPLSSEAVRGAAAEGARWIERALFGPPWTGYYVEFAASGPMPRYGRLLVAAGEFPGLPARPSVEGRIAFDSPWSADGELVAIANASRKVYVGDRLGNVREIADLGAGYAAQRTGWVGPRRVFAIVDGIGRGQLWVATIEVGTGALELRRLETPIVRLDDPELPVGAFAFVSPDGRWLPVTLAAGGCREQNALYDLVTDRLVDVVDAAGRPAYAAGWLSDGRLVSASCDRSAARIDVFVSAPGVRPQRPVATLPFTASVAVFAFDRVNDRIFVSSESATEDRIVPILDPTGRVIRTVRLPQLTRNGDFNHATLSRDGRFLSFRVVEPRGAERITRSGVVDLVTGQISDACDVHCARLALR